MYSSFCVCLHVRLSEQEALSFHCHLSVLSQLQTVSSFPAHLAQSRLSLRHQPPSGLPPHAVRVCCYNFHLSLFFFVLTVLQLKCSLPSLDVLLISLFVVLCHHCNVSLLSVCSRSHVLFSISNPSMFFCMGCLAPVSVWCLFHFLSLSGSLSFLHTRSWYPTLSQTWVKMLLHINV